MTLSAIIVIAQSKKFSFTFDFAPGFVMKISATFIVGIFAQIGIASAQPPQDLSSKITYPEAARSAVIEEHFGRKVSDPYRWLENDAADDHSVAAWIAAQHTVTQNYLAALPGRDLFKRRMMELLDYEQSAAPVKRGDRYFFSLNKGLAEDWSLYVREGVLGEARMLIDPDSLSQHGADTLASWDASDDGRFVAFSMAKTGSTTRSIKVLEVGNGRHLEDTVRQAPYTGVAWAPDGSGFFYSQITDANNQASAQASTAVDAVYFHKLGTPQAEDHLVYSAPKRADQVLRADRVPGGRYLSITSMEETHQGALAVVDLSSQDWAPRTIETGIDARWSVLGSNGEKLILATTNAADRGRIVSLDLADDVPKPVEIVAEASDKAVLNQASLVGGKLLIAYLVDARTEVRRFTLDGKPDGTVTLPGIGTAGGFQGSADDSEVFFVFTSYNAPTSIYRYDTTSHAVAPWMKPKVPIDLDKFTVEQRFYRSKDGTEVPLSLVRRKDVQKAAPTLLHVYNRSGVSQVPIYNPMQLAWVEQGGVLAIANIRGGGDYGRDWYRTGKRENQQNGFDDFIAAAEFLKRTGITTQNGLAIQGEWGGGGLVVGAVTNQRPDLFDVAMPGTGSMDMLRYEKFPGGASWTREYGSPTEERHFRHLIGYSPYHNIRDGKDYPAILATTIDTDARFASAHMFKYSAALQAAELGSKPRLVRIDELSNQAERPLDRIISRHADMWAFAAYWTGLKTHSVK